MTRGEVWLAYVECGTDMTPFSLQLASIAVDIGIALILRPLPIFRRFPYAWAWSLVAIGTGLLTFFRTADTRHFSLPGLLHLASTLLIIIGLTALPRPKRLRQAGIVCLFLSILSVGLLFTFFRGIFAVSAAILFTIGFVLVNPAGTLITAPGMERNAETEDELYDMVIKAIGAYHSWRSKKVDKLRNKTVRRD